MRFCLSWVESGFEKLPTSRVVKRQRLLPRRLEWNRLEGLNIDRNILQDLQAIEISFRNGLFDPSAVLSRTVVEKAARRLYEASKKQRCPKNWGLDQLNDDLYNSKAYDRKIHAKVLGLLQQTNPIVHGEVSDIGESYLRIVVALAQSIIEDIYLIMPKQSV